MRFEARAPRVPRLSCIAILVAGDGLSFDGALVGGEGAFVARIDGAGGLVWATVLDSRQ